MTAGADPYPVPQTRAEVYFALALAWSIPFLTASALLGGMPHRAGQVLFYVGGAGPPLAAFVLTHFYEPKSVQRDFWQRITDPRLMSWPWLAAAFLIHPLLVLMALGFDLWLGGTLNIDTSPLFSTGGPFGFLAFAFFFGALPMEIGWRGFALDRLQLRMTPLRASLALATVWALFHVPLFYVDGTFQHKLGGGSPQFWIFLSSLFPVSVIITWIYNHSNRSILAAALVYFSGHFMGTVVTKSTRLAALELALLMALATLVVLDPRTKMRILLTER